MLPVNEISRQLNDCADRVASYLLPDGKRMGRDWCAGDTSGGSGESLKVCINGPKVGIWTDFATGQRGGDLLDLWRECRSCSLLEAISQAKAWLGIRDTRMETPARKEYRKPGRQPQWQPVTTPAIKWLNETRKLSLLTIDAYRLEYVRHAKLGDCVLLPFLRDGKLIAAKYRSFPGKDFTQEAGCEPCLFGWQCVPDGIRQIIITEGEFDTMALHTYGFAALSVDKGGGAGEKQGWVQTEYDRLAQYDRILLALDNDPAGKEGAAEIIKRLGQDRCAVVAIPRGLKDFNECLIQGVPVEEVRQSLEAAKSCDPPELRPVGSFTDEVCAIFGVQSEIGLRLPWKKCGDDILLRPGEVTVLAGYNGSGKSQLVGEIVLAATLRDAANTCVASLEFKTSKWLARLVKQACATDKPADGFVRAAMNALSGVLWSFDLTSAVDAKRMVEVFRYAARRYKCELFVIDNLAKCGIPEDDYRGQHLFIQAITNFAKDEDVHVIVVHHMRKASNESEQGGKFGIKGSGVITDLVDTVLTNWRNKPKEKEIRDAAIDHREPDKEKTDQPDAILTCHKQRNGDDEPSYGLWFDPKCYRFMENAMHRPRPMIEWSAHEDRH